MIERRKQEGERKLEKEEEKKGGNKYIMRIFHYTPPQSKQTYTHSSCLQCDIHGLKAAEEFKQLLHKIVSDPKDKYSAATRSPYVYSTYKKTHRHTHTEAKVGQEAALQKPDTIIS